MRTGIRDSAWKSGCASAACRVTVRTGPIVYRYADSGARRECAGRSRRFRRSPCCSSTRSNTRAPNAPFDRTMRVYVHSAAAAPREVDVSLALPARAQGRHGDAPRVARGRSATRISISACRASSPAGRDSIVADARRADGESVQPRLRARSSTSTFAPQRFYRRSTVQIEAVNATFAEPQDRLHPRRRRQRDADARGARATRRSSSIPRYAAAARISSGFTTIVHRPPRVRGESGARSPTRPR